MILQTRDREILKICYEHHFLLMKHVERFFFKGKHPQKARQRILELGKAGLVERVPTSVLGISNRLMIRLTVKGIETVRSQYPHELYQPKRINLAIQEHDAYLIAARLRLMEIWDATWIPSSVLDKDEYKEKPDGLIRFASGREVAIEIETKAQSYEKLQKHFRRNESHGFFLTLYVASYDGLFNYLKNNLEKNPIKVPIGIITHKTLLSDSPSFWCQKGEILLNKQREY